MQVAIIGAGLAGTLLALQLKKSGVDCVLFERRTSTLEGAGIVIASNGLRVLEHAGVLPRIVQQSVTAGPWQFENQMGQLLARIRDARHASAFQTRIVSRRILQQILEEEVRAAGVAIHHGVRLETLEQDATTVTLHFKDGQTHTADCVIGADGVGSAVRRSLFPEMSAAKYTGFTAYAGISGSYNSAHSREEQQTVHLMFGRTSAFEYTTLWTEHGLRTLWWSTAQADLAPRTQGVEQTLTDHIDHLQRLHSGWQPIVHTLLASATEITPIAIHAAPTLTQWSRGRVCVLGDAAHSIGPHSGQAAAMALEDAQTAAKVLRSCSPRNVATQLQHIATLRHERIQRVMQLSERAEVRKKEMTPLKYWLMQQNIRLRVPVGARKNKAWLLDYRVSKEGLEA